MRRGRSTRPAPHSRLLRLAPAVLQVGPRDQPVRVTTVHRPPPSRALCPGSPLTAATAAYAIARRSCRSAARRCRPPPIPVTQHGCRPRPAVPGDQPLAVSPRHRPQQLPQPLPPRVAHRAIVVPGDQPVTSPPRLPRCSPSRLHSTASGALPSSPPVWARRAARAMRNVRNHRQDRRRNRPRDAPGRCGGPCAMIAYTRAGHDHRSPCRYEDEAAPCTRMMPPLSRT